MKLFVFVTPRNDTSIVNVSVFILGMFSCNGQTEKSDGCCKRKRFRSGSKERQIGSRVKEEEQTG